MESVRTWNHVAAWEAAASQSLDPVALALCRELLSFLKEKNLLDRHFNARDLAALTLYAASDEALRHTVRTIMRTVAETHAGLGTFKFGSVGMDASIGVFQSWIYLNGNLQHGGSRFWIGVGVCAEAGPAFDDDFAGFIGKEPFFLVYFGDENLKQRPVECLSVVPEGWTEMKARPALIATKPVRDFPSGPDRRAEAAGAWA